jgi:hypothetical protein
VSAMQLAFTLSRMDPGQLAIPNQSVCIYDQNDQTAIYGAARGR